MDYDKMVNFYEFNKRLETFFKCILIDNTYFFIFLWHCPHRFINIPLIWSSPELEAVQTLFFFFSVT